MVRADFFATRTDHGPERGTSCPVAVTDPATHPKNEARPIQSPFSYEPSTHVKNKS